MQTLKSLRFLAVAMLLATAAATRADYVSLTVKETAGTWTSFGLNGLKVTFSADNITVSNPEMVQTFPVSDVWSLQLTDLPTGVNGAADGRQSSLVVSTGRGRISVSAAPGAVVRVYSATGQQCATLRIDSSGTPASVGNLAPGVYILRAGNGTRKLVIR